MVLPVAVSGPCPNGSSKGRNGKCYGWANMENEDPAVDFFNARRICQEQSGFLPEPKSKLDNEVLAL